MPQQNFRRMRNEIPTTYKTLEQALALMYDAVQGEAEDEMFYSYLISIAPTKNEKDIYLDLEKQKSELINLIHSGDIETIHSQEPCLEDIFINLTGEKINDK